MAKPFDPYHRWLGIPPRHQPPNHYRLLGIETFEEDPGVIETAADQRMMLLRTFQAGEHADDSQRLLNEVSAAKVRLLSARKSEYDAQLRAETAEEAETAVEPPPAANVVPRNSSVLEALPPLPPEPSPHEAPGIPRGADLRPLGMVQAASRRPPVWQRTPFLWAVGAGGLAGSLLLIMLLVPPWNGDGPRRRQSARVTPGRSDGGNPVEPPPPPAVDGDGGNPVDPPFDPTREPIRPGRAGELAFDPEQLLVLYTFEQECFAQQDGGQLVRDLSGHGHDAVVNGAVPAAGRSGAGMYFDGFDDYLGVPSLREALLGRESLTVCAWCRRVEIPNKREPFVFFDVGSFGHKSVTLCLHQDGHHQFTMAGFHGGGSVKAATAVDTEWHHVAGVWDGGEMRLLVDGVVAGRRATNNLSLTTRSIDPYMVRLGGQAKTLNRRWRYLKGAIDEFALFTAALSDEQVREVFEAGQRGELLRVRQ